MMYQFCNLGGIHNEYELQTNGTSASCSCRDLYIFARLVSNGVF